MSRHRLTALPECGGCEVTVGWDADSGTFFASVIDRRAVDVGKDPWLVQMGGRPLEVRDPYDVIHAVRPYAVIPAGLVDELAAEAAAAPEPQLWANWTAATVTIVMPAAAPGP